MGGANNICSDKTGTLTKNQMTVVRLFIQENDYSKPFDASKFKKNVLEVLCEG
jgi:P-type E1-E2 ATPase